MSSSSSTTISKKLDHVVFIMDGNGRWAKKRLLPRSLGHRAGVKNIKKIIDLCFNQYKIKVCSLYCFSTENWNRPQDEISYLFNLLRVFFNDEIDSFIKNEVRILVSGDLNDQRIPLEVKEAIENAIEKTKDFKEKTFNVLFNFGGRDEITRAVKKIAIDVKEGKINPESITEKVVESYLDTASLPPVDLLIRTSGEQRISNCMLWEIAYAEMEFVEVYWPSFSPKDLEKALEEYQNRNRRFGGLKNE